MKLPVPFTIKKREKPEFFLSLLLKEEKITAIVFEELEGKIRVLGQHDETLESSLTLLPTDDLLNILDIAISTAEQTLPHGIETQKTVFGVQEDWVEETTIKKEYLAKLKVICDAFGLSPIGFIVITEAIAHLLAKEEGAPVSAILIDVGNKNLVLSIIRAGRLVTTKKAPLNESPAVTTDTLLHHFTHVEVLPSRIILYTYKNTERTTQEFIRHSWSKTLPFLHVPQITTLPLDFEAKAVVSGAATQLGFEMQVNRHANHKPFLPISEESVTPVKKSEDESSIERNPNMNTSEDFGFMKEQDILEIASQQSTLIEEKEEPQLAIPQAAHPDMLETHHHRPKHTTASQLLRQILGLASKISLLFVLKKIQFPTVPLLNQGTKVMFIPFLVLILVVGLLLIYITQLKATITVYAKPNVIDKTEEVTFSIDTDSDFSKNIIALESETITQETTLAVPATGSKEVGEKAKGTITIFNVTTTQSQSFPKNAVITASNGLTFLLDNAVNISSASGDALRGITPSTAKASVTAEDIGKEYNLPSGVEFTVESLPKATVAAKNDSAFSGGSKKEVTVVAKKDIDKLLNEVSSQLEQKAREELLKKQESDKQYLPTFISSTFEKKELDKTLGQEAKSVGISAAIVFHGVSYKKTALEDYAKYVIQKESPDSNISSEDININIQDLQKKDDNQLQTKVSLKAQFLPKIDTKKIAEDIHGKSFQDTQQILSKISQVVSIDISLSPNIPILPKLLPQKSSNITILTKKDV